MSKQLVATEMESHQVNNGKENNNDSAPLPKSASWITAGLLITADVIGAGVRLLPLYTNLIGDESLHGVC